MIELIFVTIWMLIGAVLWFKCGQFEYNSSKEGFLKAFLEGFIRTMVPLCCMAAWPFLVIVTLIAGENVQYDDENGWSTFMEEDEDA